MQTEYIPPNIDNSGNKVAGIFRLRNLTEGIIIAVAAFFLLRIILLFLPSIIQISIQIFVSLILFAFFTIGIRGMPVSVALANKIIYNKTKCRVSLRKPRPIENNIKKPKFGLLGRRRDEK